jgi:23S rRNA pseudouridine1911/1915/1917 synthase
VTGWRIEKCFPLSGSRQWASWVRLKPKTGRTHQIRVHLADLGYPIVGDKVYGRRKRQAATGAAALLESFPRQVLHAEILALDHPRTGAPMVFSAAVADDIRELLGKLNAPPAEVEKGVDKNSAFK